MELWAKQNNAAAAIIMGSQFRTGTPRDGFAINVHNGGVGWTAQMGSHAGTTMTINGAAPVSCKRLVAHGAWSGMGPPPTFTLWARRTEPPAPAIWPISSILSLLAAGLIWPVPYNGAIDEVAFYNYALTQSQIQSHVDFGLPLFTATAPATNVIANSKPVGDPFDGRGANAFWSNSVSDAGSEPRPV